MNPKRAAVRALKYLSPVITVLGILLLLWVGKTYGTPAVKIASLGKRNNYAQVSITGKISQDIRFYKSTRSRSEGAGSLEFMVDDGTGIIKVRLLNGRKRRLNSTSLRSST